MVYVLGIESSCDDTSAAVSLDSKVLSNVIANQKIHKDFGGVVPEFASRAHQQNIVPVVEEALKQAGVSKGQLHAVAFTAGPGLLGSLLVGVSYAKAFALSLNIPLIEVNHLQAHVFAHFIQKPESYLSIESKGSSLEYPQFPFICLTVSGGHTQIVIIKDYFDMEIIGETIDDAAGETFDKAAKILGLQYPGGPEIDVLAKGGNPRRFKFAKPRVVDKIKKNNFNQIRFDFSFSGLKTSFLYFIRDELKKNPDFIEENINDLCASIQKCIIDILIEKLISATKKTGINEIAIAGGVSANSYLRERLNETKDSFGWNVFIPSIAYSTDNAAMIAVTGYFKYLKNEFTSQTIRPYSRA